MGAIEPTASTWLPRSLAVTPTESIFRSHLTARETVCSFKLDIGREIDPHLRAIYRNRNRNSWRIR